MGSQQTSSTQIKTQTHIQQQQQQTYNKLYTEQIKLEAESRAESALKYEAMLNAARSRKDYTTLPPVRKRLVQWYKVLKDAITNEQELYIATGGMGKKRDAKKKKKKKKKKKVDANIVTQGGNDEGDGNFFKDGEVSDGSLDD